MKKANVLHTVPYDVVPMNIQKELFLSPRRDSFVEELARECILDALEMVEKEPQKYAKPFRIMRVVGRYNMKANELLTYCEENLKCTYADWTEKALEKAQRITNGEGWKEVCEHPDTKGWTSMRLY